MSRKAYGGVSDKARTGIKIYGGVNDIARTVIKGYGGDSQNIARQWWPPANTVAAARTDLVPGTTYELNTCLPVMAVMYALEEIRKIMKPAMKSWGIYDTYQHTKGDMLADFIQNQGDNNIVYITGSISTSVNALLYVTFYLGKAESLSRTVSSVTTDEHYGNTYATISENVQTNKSIHYTIDTTTKAVTRTTGTTPFGFNKIGLEIQYTSGGRNLRVTNLGMTMYDIHYAAQGDWHWRFDGSTGFYDFIDHLKATTSDGSESSALGRDNYIQIPAFCWEQYRTIKVKTEHFSSNWEERYDTLAIEDHGDDFHYYSRVEYAGESADHQKHYYRCYYKYYFGGNIVGMYSPSASQYSSQINYFSVEPTTKPCLANNYNEQKGRAYWAGLYNNEYGDIVGDMTDLEPGGFQFSVDLLDNGYEFSIGANHYEAPPIICTRYLRIGNPKPWQQSYKALAGYRITEIQID